ncbi:MAG: hypothetical protein RL685_6856 [Pseudomonadota bacterium]
MLRCCSVVPPRCPWCFQPAQRLPRVTNCRCNSHRVAARLGGRGANAGHFCPPAASLPSAIYSVRLRTARILGEQLRRGPRCECCAIALSCALSLQNYTSRWPALSRSVYRAAHVRATAPVGRGRRATGGALLCSSTFARTVTKTIALAAHRSCAASSAYESEAASQCASSQARPWPTSTTSGTSSARMVSMRWRIAGMACSTSASGTSNTSSS